MHAAHVAAEPLTIFEVYLADLALVNIRFFSVKIISLILLSSLGLAFGWLLHNGLGSTVVIRQFRLNGLRVLWLGGTLNDLSWILELVLV